ncbi:alpha/beta fold hydrolase [Allonocardiopsis opalescens]|uniref:Pimeloyl-ACP methyl ester carboxylesterase n=1 Tax=Allonocardiopsis opalescens TaxID=1144618 RepID=A0A2T0QDJ0_9ACTN|nr:alpha/beta hydrolase [Allonocardiopsis opalescens]PRY01989.1 pimeloyl-ACP methyl ester carboxylesterase [Allonocardiopsis opalescens]
MAELAPWWPGAAVEVDGRELFVRRGPEPSAGREPAVFVHGLGGSATNWTDLMAELGDVLAGAAPDLPGFGESPPPPDDDYSIDAHADVVAGLVEALGRGPVHLFGNSMGGAVATRVAAQRPELVRSLTLVTPALPDLRPRPHPYQLLSGLLPVLGPVGHAWLLRRPPEAQVRTMLDMCYHDPGRVPPPRMTATVEEYRRRAGLAHVSRAELGSLRGLVQEYVRSGPRALWRQAGLVECPVLLVYGRHDKLVDARMALRAGQAFRDSRTVVLSDSGHLPMMEHPAAVAREVRALLDDVAPGPRR